MRTLGERRLLVSALKEHSRSTRLVQGHLSVWVVSPGRRTSTHVTSPFSAATQCRKGVWRDDGPEQPASVLAGLPFRPWSILTTARLPAGVRAWSRTLGRQTNPALFTPIPWKHILHAYEAYQICHPKEELSRRPPSGTKRIRNDAGRIGTAAESDAANGQQVERGLLSPPGEQRRALFKVLGEVGSARLHEAARRDRRPVATPKTESRGTAWRRESASITCRRISSSASVLICSRASTRMPRSMCMAFPVMLKTVSMSKSYSSTVVYSPPNANVSRTSGLPGFGRQ